MKILVRLLMPLAVIVGATVVVCARLLHQDIRHLALPVALVVLLVLAVLWWDLIRPLSTIVRWMRRFRFGEPDAPWALPRKGFLAPLAREARRMAQSLVAARAAAAEEARLRNAGESRWTPDRLREHVRTALKGRPLVVVSNREPYVHVRQDRQIRCLTPPGGLVTAMEPVLRACSGTWIAAGTGEADRDTADAHGRLRVPPDAPLYTLRRIWLTPEEEQGHYYGFANEGLWPLCHIAHTRPVFRADDWHQYVRVNEKFAEAVFEEIADTDEPCLVVQDYHLALLPRLVKDKRPDAKIALFWHIPWPNPEAFGICPWARELLQGMLGADLVGFHIQFHCNNFLDTVDRMLESRIDWEHFSVTRADRTTWVKPFPISIAGPAPDASPAVGAGQTAKEAVLKSLGITARWLGVGVDRLDYTKGLLERLSAIERFLDKYPAFREQFVFVELGAPSRTKIPRYQEFEASVEAEIERINRRFQTRAWKPIVFLKKQHSHQEIAPFYQAADVCLVTSLHDGMNLVSKEFVASRTDERGVLILSQFTGASRELLDALLVNPYDIDQVADAVQYAVTMEPEEQQARMSRMRETVQEHNVYRWAAALLTELARLRPSPAPAASPLQLPAE
ncbi:MAG: trehalose-6-phosphate synthase [Candidatus Omnitrophica bacterium]|nr:trehalose-6-phosphate synthase [Candidatus Omnitrophota bacterium]